MLPSVNTKVIRGLFKYCIRGLFKYCIRGRHSLMILLLFTIAFLLCNTHSCQGKLSSKKFPLARKRLLSKRFMLRAFIMSIFDPTLQGAIKVKKIRGKTKKRRKSSLLDESSFVVSSGSFGPVCGPNGCF